MVCLTAFRDQSTIRKTNGRIVRFSVPEPDDVSIFENFQRSRKAEKFLAGKFKTIGDIENSLHLTCTTD